MNEMNKADFQLFKTIAQMKQKSLHKTMGKLMYKYFDKEKITIAKEYIICEGNIPIMLVAHMDTVFKKAPERIYYDSKKRVMWSPEGLGADDRAGVFAILKILQAGFRPSICFTTDEELGSIGAKALVRDFKTCPFDLKYIIELDRRGKDDCVFYDCVNEEFTDYVEKFGFITDWGTFSDISDICPSWKIAGVNLSVGYRDEHSIAETLNTNALFATINKVIKMLEDVENTKYYIYIPDTTSWYYSKIASKYFQYFEDDDWEDNMYPSEYESKSFCQCHKCKKILPENEVFFVKSKRYKDCVNHYCMNCVVNGVNWCKNCGAPFETDSSEQQLCPDCAGTTLPDVSVV